MDFGQQLGAFFLELTANLALAAFGVMSLATVIAGLSMGLHFGGSKVQEVARGWFWNILGCAIFTGTATVLVRSIQSKFVGG